MRYDIKYKYFPDSENIIIVGVDKDKHKLLNECVVSPNRNGITIISFYNANSEQQGYDHLIALQKVVESTLPRYLNYEITGFS